MKIRTKTTFDPRLQQNGQTACKIVNYKKNPRFQVLPAAIYSCIIQKVDVCKRHHGALAQLGERIAGSDEVRGSIPLGSIPNEIKRTCHRTCSFFVLGAIGVRTPQGSPARTERSVGARRLNPPLKVFASSAI
jgi:hypothetical protein